MRVKLWVIFGIASLCFCGCVRQEDTRDPSQTQEFTPSPTDLTSIPTLATFQVGTLQDLLNAAYQLPPYTQKTGDEFQPVCSSDDGFLYGYIGTASLAYTDVNRQAIGTSAYQFIPLPDQSMQSHQFKILYAAKQYMLFCDTLTRTLYMYDQQQNTSTIVTTFANQNTSLTSAQVVDTSLYFSLEDATTQYSYRYDCTTKSCHQILNEHTSSPMYIDTIMYDIQVNENNTVGVYAELNHQRNELLLKSKEEGFFRSLMSDGKDLYIPYQIGTQLVIYRYEVAKQQLLPFVRLENVSLLQLSDSYLSWYDEAKGYCLLSLKTKVYYPHGTYPLYLTNRGIVWNDTSGNHAQIWYAVLTS